jgi:phosphatidate cytidylyltransferase
VLAQRVASAAIGIPLIFLLILVGGNWYVAAVAAALAVATLEFAHPHHGWTHPLSLLAAAFAAALASGAHVGFDWMIWFAAGAVMLTLIAVLRDFDASRALTDWFWTIGPVVYVGLLGSFMVLLRDVHDGRDWVYLAVFSTFATDTGAYFSGRAVGRRAMAPRVSPKKTWEGFAGGYASGFAAVLLLNHFLGIRVDAADAVVLGLALPVAAALGDLVESAIKRSMHVKDASELIPGHGGVLDRLDSLLFTFPATYFFIQWVLY